MRVRRSGAAASGCWSVPAAPRREPAGLRHGLLGLLVVTLAVAGCASTGTRGFAYTPETLMATTRARVPAAVQQDLVVPFAVTEEMVERGRKIVSPARSEYEKARLLVRSITQGGDAGFGLEYEVVATAPAVETVARGSGNCLSLTSVFVGLARELGLQAYYVDASDRVNELRREEELIVDSGHIAAVARTERGYTLVDFDGEVQDYRTFKIIDDVTALAHYYNNRGYELIQVAVRDGREIPWPEARRSFELATLVDRGFARAYNNLGVVHARLHQPEEAERAYRSAIEADSRFATPHHNIGNLRLSAGALEAAVEAYDRALSLTRRNPYLYFHRGVALYRQGDFESAAESFEKAVSLKRDYIEPRNLLAQAYDQLGRHEEATKIRAAVRAMTRR